MKTSTGVLLSVAASATTAVVAYYAGRQSSVEDTLRYQKRWHELPDRARPADQSEPEVTGARTVEEVFAP